MGSVTFRAAAWPQLLVVLCLLGACSAPAPKTPSTSAGPTGSSVYGQFADARSVKPDLRNE